MKLFYLVLSFVALFLLDFFFKSNISVLGKGSSGLPVLGAFWGLAGVLLLWRMAVHRLIIVRQSVFILLLFWAYFVLRIGIDKGTVASLKASTIGTTGGVLLFYAIGAVLSIINGQHRVNAIRVGNYFNLFSFLFISYVAVSLYFLIEVFFELNSKLRADIILIDSEDSHYQRPGNFLVMSYILVLMLYTQFVSMRPRYMSIWSYLSGTIVLSLFIAYTMLALLVSQMFGSNNATVLIAGLGMVGFATIMMLKLTSVQCLLASSSLGFKGVLCRGLMVRLIAFLIGSIIVFTFLVLMLASYLNVDLGMTRLGGFGSGEISSIASRLALLDNFIVHFSFSPLLGNMNVDCLTTGCGSYVHSLPATLLTHTGLIGFFLFVFYLCCAYLERLKDRKCEMKGVLLAARFESFQNVLFFTTVLLLGVLATFFTWSILWFALGLFMTGFDFKK
ncbi:hypothetical protein ACMXYO_02925 [Neptuniibacter sp. QD37_6]|uniref:hypothetical protein n=1 Tax=Neptuniibacter sp. QD37_6 TaxID=3398210 RepID=UPI0039F591C3